MAAAAAERKKAPRLAISGKKHLVGCITGNRTQREAVLAWLTANATVRVEEGRNTSITRTGKEIHQSVSSLHKRQKVRHCTLP